MGDRNPRSIHGAGHLSRYVASHPGQLSLAIPSWVGAMSTSQRAVTPCVWGVKAGMVRVWMTGKLCDPLGTHDPYLSALAVVLFPLIRRYTNIQITLTLILSKMHKNMLFSREGITIQFSGTGLAPSTPCLLFHPKLQNKTCL